MTIRPTGWTFRPTKKTLTKEDLLEFSLHPLKPTYTQLIYQGRAIPVAAVGIPYSEHSSVIELEIFLKGLTWWPRKIVPTVNITNPKRREEMQRMMESWRVETLK